MVQRKNKRDAHLSPDGQWRTFPKVPNLSQYIATGLYFGRVKVNGKSFRESFETTVVRVTNSCFSILLLRFLVCF